MLRPLTKRDLETMADLAAANHSHLKLDAYEGWAKPLDIGGRDCSHHSGTLKKLARRGLVDVKNASEKRPGCSKYYRAGCWYRINEKGLAAIKANGA